MNKIECPVCYDDIPYNIINPCGHSLCNKCSVFKTCPLCQYNIVSYIPNRILKELKLEKSLSNLNKLETTVYSGPLWKNLDKSDLIDLNFYNDLFETIELSEKIVKVMFFVIK